MHKPDQGELQLDRSQLSRPEYLGLSTAGDSPVQNHKKGPPQSRKIIFRYFCIIIIIIMVPKIIFSLSHFYSHILKLSPIINPSIAPLFLYQVNLCFSQLSHNLSNCFIIAFNSFEV